MMKILKQEQSSDAALVVLTPTAARSVFVGLLLLCASTLVSPPVALLLGILMTAIVGHPFRAQSAKLTPLLLQASVVGLGFSMNINKALAAGREGLLFTVVSILGTLLLGALLGRFLRVDRHTAHLLSCGTAICGGSAIAAVAPVIGAEQKQISVALGTVFLLNSAALFIFPAIGHTLQLTQNQFGLWCAIAIHDTSSVVGAAGKYGAEALGVATTVKLLRALWIIPVALGTALLFGRRSARMKIPWFIGYFICALLCHSYVPGAAVVAPFIVAVAKAGLTVTLFLIGSGLSRNMLRAVGMRPLLLGVLLWLLISAAALWAVTGLR